MPRSSSAIGARAALLGAALALGGMGCGTRTEAPKANPDLLPPAAEEPENKATQDEAAEPREPEGAAPSAKPTDAPKPTTERPVLAGFSELAFGEKYGDLKNGAKLRKRCKGRVSDFALEKEFPGQSFEARTLSCDALIADRYADMWLSFDHEHELYEVRFRFETSIAASMNGSRVRELGSEEIDKLVADLRAVLEPTLGQPSDLSSQGIGGRAIRLQWQGRTEDAPAHETEANVSLGVGLVSTQYVEWADLTRKTAMKAQIDKERTESIRSKGL